MSSNTGAGNTAVCFGHVCDGYGYGATHRNRPSTRNRGLRSFTVLFRHVCLLLLMSLVASVRVRPTYLPTFCSDIPVFSFAVPSLHFSPLRPLDSQHRSDNLQPRCLHSPFLHRPPTEPSFATFTSRLPSVRAFFKKSHSFLIRHASLQAMDTPIPAPTELSSSPCSCSTAARIEP